VDHCHCFLARLSFRVAPFIAVPILALHFISHLLSLSGSFHFLRLASGLQALTLPTFVTVRLADLLKLD